MIYAELISIGDELLSGLTIDTNSAFIAQQFESIGIFSRWKTTVGDDLDDICGALESALARADVITLTGGLGPTHDDMTKKALCRHFNVGTKFYPEILEKMRLRFERRGYPFPIINRNQAEYPEVAELMHNSAGSAQGMIFKVGEKQIFVMPGVPREMKAITTEEILPRLMNQTSHRMVRMEIHTTGVPESQLFEQIHEIFEAEPAVRVAYLPKHTGVTIRLSLADEAEASARAILSNLVEKVTRRMPEGVFGSGNDTLPGVVGELLKLRHLKVATAESCTGGLIASMITDVSGSSDYFETGFVTYADKVKQSLLGVPPDVLKNEGAVSEATIRHMLAGALERTSADYAIAVSGIAGPTGGTPEKPVGLVWIGVGRKDDFVVKRYQFGRDRVMNKEMTAMAALNQLRIKLQQDFVGCI
ncbi:MAG: hypothetical protein AUJ47_12150 [Candidatus Marinimicrobia bacterium CG1_02_48_14]|nr:MAG: hypothetical protein AUJ47_12150 [Candidatus Marinimicrobia bacterium CG1_02_48_14]